MKTASVTQPAWRSFWSLLLLQGQNSFNDKIAQFLIIPLAFWLTANTESDHGSIQHILGVVVVLPYLLFAPISGWLSDRFSKKKVIQGTVFAQTVTFLLMMLAVVLGQFWLLVAGFFLLAVQSMVMSPAKRGLIKELVGEEKLGSASGVLEMSVVLAICAGQIIAGYWFAHQIQITGEGWNAMRTPMLVLLAATVVPIVLSYMVKDTGAKGAPKWQASQAFSHFSQLKLLFADRDIKRCAIGKAFFWGFAGVLNLWQIAIADDLSTATGRELGAVLSEIMIAASGGVILGGIGASLLSRKRIELGMAPIGLCIMVVGSILLGFYHEGSPMMYVAFALAGLGGAVYLVPVNAQLQNIAPENQRGQILAGGAVLDCLFGISAVAFQYAFTKIGLGILPQALVVALMVMVVLVLALRLLGRELIRFVLSRVFKRLYRITAQGMDNIPEEGGVLLTPNHISYLDTMILSYACPRPVRFLMVRDCFKTPGVGLFARLFDTIPISRERAKEAVTKAADALEEGTVVCIFPEGRLTRTGALAELKRGFQMIARKAKAPVVPVYMDGLWGTLTSFERDKMYWKKPRFYPAGVRVHFGEPLEGKENITSENVGRSMHELSHAAMYERAEVQSEKWIRKRLGELPKGIKARLEAMPWSELQPYLFNAIQLRELGVFRDRLRLGYEEGVEGEVVIALLAAITRSEVWVLPKGEKPGTTELHDCDYLFVGEALRPMRAQVRNCTVFDVNGDLLPEGKLDALYFPAKVVDGYFELFSMPHPTKLAPSDALQPGWKPGSYGRVLPGAQIVPEGADHEFFVF